MKSNEEILLFATRELSDLDRQDNFKVSQSINALISQLKDLRFQYVNKSDLRKDIELFFECVKNLPQGIKCDLKRSLGVSSINALNFLYPVYYKVDSFRCASEEQRNLWCLCAQIYCFMGDEEKGILFSDCLLDCFKSENSQVKFERFLATSTKKYEYFSRDLISYVRMIKSNNKKFDCCQLLFDLLYWNSESLFVQLKWAEVLEKIN